MKGEGLVAITALPKLEELRLCMAQHMADADAELLSCMPNLHSLDLECGSIDAPGVAYVVTNPSLTHLSLSSQVHADALAPLTTAIQLNALHLECPDITDAFFGYLTALVALTALSVTGNHDITADGIAELTSLKALRFVDVSTCSGVDIEMLSDVVALRGVVFAGRGIEWQ